MDIEFSDGLEFPVRPLMEAVPEMLAEIPEKAREDAEILKLTLDDLRVRITGSDNWRFEASGFGILYISRRAFEFLWVFVYAHLVIYAKIFAERRVAGDIDIGKHPELALPREMLTWLHSDVARHGQAMPVHFPSPDPKVERKSLEGIAFRLALHAIRFHIFHELAHLVFARKGNRPPLLLDEERACDLQAIRWMTTRAAGDYAEHEGTKTGAAMGLLYLAAFGIDTGRHDGVTHPRSYHRLVDTLREAYGAKEDRVWGPVLAVLAAHCSNMHIKINCSKDGYDTFRDASLFVRQTIDEILDS